MSCFDQNKTNKVGYAVAAIVVAFFMFASAGMIMGAKASEKLVAQQASYVGLAGTWSGNPGGPLDPFLEDSARGSGVVIRDLGNNVVIVDLFTFERRLVDGEIKVDRIDYVSTPCDLSGTSCQTQWRPVVATESFRVHGVPNESNQIGEARIDLASQGSISILEVFCGGGSSHPNVCPSPQPVEQTVSVMVFNVAGRIFRMSEYF